MAKKKPPKRGGIVYSTDPGYEPEPETTESEETLPPGKQDLRISVDRLKGNKRVVRIYQFVGQVDDLKDLGKHLKQHCGCGGSVKNGEILLQGEVLDKVKAELSRLGYRYKQAGG